MSRPIIGILGGMGPRATVDFEARLLEHFPGSDQSIPTIISINDGSIPDRTAFLLGTGEDPVPVLAKNARQLLMLGATIIAMPCNTAHAGSILGRLKQRVTLPIIDMPMSCMKYAQSMGTQQVLILGTDGTKHAGVFDTRSRTVSCAYPSQAIQRLVMRAIGTIKRGNTVDPADLIRLQHYIKDSKAEIIFLACTELGVLQNALGDTRVVDSLDVLAEACARHARNLYTTNKENDHDTRFIYN